MSFGLIGGSSFGRPNIGWNNSSRMNRSKRNYQGDRRSGGRMGGKNFHQLPGSPMYSGGAPKQSERVNYGPRDASMSAKGSFSENTKATRLHKFNKTNNGGNGPMKPSFKKRGKYSSNGGGGNNNNNVGNTSFSFDKSIINGISHLELPTTQNIMGGGAHLQSLDYPASTWDSSKLYIKNIELRPTGLNLPNSDIFNFFSTRVFPAYETMLQERVNRNIQVEISQFQQWFFNIQNALNLWFYLDSVLSYYDKNPVANEAMSTMRSNISAEALNTFEQLGKVLQTKVMDPSMVNLIRYIHDTYTCSPTNPQATLIKFSYAGTMGEDSVQLETLLEEALVNMSNTDLNKINTVMRQAKPEWTIRLDTYDGKAKYDENFLTFWANIPEKFDDNGTMRIQPTLPDENGVYVNEAHFNIFGNNYSQVLSGLSCFNVSPVGEATDTSVHTGFISPSLAGFQSIKTSHMRWDTLMAQFVPAGLGSSEELRHEAAMCSPSSSVVMFSTVGGNPLNGYPTSVLKPWCQEPISMNVKTTRQDFNHAMEALFNWTNL